MAKPSKKADGVKRAVKKTARDARRHADQSSSPRKAKARPGSNRQDDMNDVNEQRLMALGRQAFIARLQAPFPDANADAAFDQRLF